MRGGPGGPTIWENDGPPLTVESCACADGAAEANVQRQTDNPRTHLST